MRKNKLKNQISKKNNITSNLSKINEKNVKKFQKKNKNNKKRIKNKWKKNQILSEKSFEKFVWINWIRT